jgi:hypothetical protein
LLIWKRANPCLPLSTGQQSNQRGIKMIAIETKFLPTTNCKGSRIKAFTCNGHSVTIPYPYEFTGHVCHFEAVKALAKKCKTHWELDKMRYGGTKQGYVFCFADSIVEESRG